MGLFQGRFARVAVAPEGGCGMTMPGAADPDTGEEGMSTEPRVDVFPGGGSKPANGADRRSRDARAAVPVFPSTFLAGVGPCGPRRRNRPIGKGRANLAIRDDAARLDAGFKSLARSMAGAILIAAIGLSWPSGADAAIVITQKPDLSGGYPGGLPVYDVSGLVAGDSFALTWGETVEGLSLTGMVTIDAFASDSATIDIWINNLSPDPDSDGDPRATVFGLSIEGFSSVDESSAPGTFLDQFVGSGGFSGFGDVAACATAASCTTGQGGGILAGDSDHFTLVVSGAFGSSLTLDSFAIKIQGGPYGADGDSYQLPGTPSVVPLPAALPLFLSALAGLALLGRRGRQAAA